MHRALALSALLAWVMIQVPLVVCDSPCGGSREALFLHADHACHDEASEAHRQCCLHGHDGCDAPADDSGTPPSGDHGAHHIVQHEGRGAPAPVALPAPAAAAAELAVVVALASLVPAGGTAGSVAWGDPGPRRRADPVSAADRLIV